MSPKTAGGRGKSSHSFKMVAPRQRPQRGRRTRVDGLKHRDVQTTPVIEKEFPAHRRNSLKPLPTTSKLDCATSFL
jgi:hypothetical protein